MYMALRLKILNPYSNSYNKSRYNITKASIHLTIVKSYFTGYIYPPRDNVLILKSTFSTKLVPERPSGRLLNVFPIVTIKPQDGDFSPNLVFIKTACYNQVTIFLPCFKQNRRENNADHPFPIRLSISRKKKQRGHSKSSENTGKTDPPAVSFVLQMYLMLDE